MLTGKLLGPQALSSIICHKKKPTQKILKKKMLFGDLTVHIGLSMIIVSPVKVFLVILCNSVLNGMVHFGI